jgi:DNA polymerase-3 subunit epsilon
MAALLENARKPKYQLRAEKAPFDFKDPLRNRGYRRNGESRC